MSTERPKSDGRNGRTGRTGTGPTGRGYNGAEPVDAHGINLSHFRAHFLERFGAAIQADYADLAPGLSEREREAGRNRPVQMVLGILLIAVGIPMIPLAGPGWAVILVGLNMIWPDNPLVPWLRKRLPVVPDEGPIPKRYYVIGAVLMAIGVVASLIYGDDVTRWFRDLIGI